MLEVKKAIVQSVCECQARLGAELDVHRHVVRGWARDPKRRKELVAPAHSIGSTRPVFEVAWLCPWCTRNQTRLFSADALAYRDAAQPVAASK